MNKILQYQQLHILPARAGARKCHNGHLCGVSADRDARQLFSGMTLNAEDAWEWRCSGACDRTDAPPYTLFTVRYNTHIFRMGGTCYGREIFIC